MLVHACPIICFSEVPPGIHTRGFTDSFAGRQEKGWFTSAAFWQKGTCDTLAENEFLVDSFTCTTTRQGFWAKFRDPILKIDKGGRGIALFVMCLFRFEAKKKKSKPLNSILYSQRCPMKYTSMSPWKCIHQENAVIFSQGQWALRHQQSIVLPEVSASQPGGRGSIPGRVIPKTLKSAI